MKAALHAAKQDWQVWTIWYDDRLEGRVRDKTRELAYVRIEEALWDKAGSRQRRDRTADRNEFVRGPSSGPRHGPGTGTGV